MNDHADHFGSLESRSDSVCRDFSFQDFHIIYRKTFIHIRIDHTQASALTWMLLGANSLASAFVKLFSPPLDAE